MKPPLLFQFIVCGFLAILILFPILYIVSTPFMNNGCQNIFELRHLSLAKNTILLASGTSLLCLLIGVPMAFMINNMRIFIKTIHMLFIIVTVLIPPYIHAIVWNQLAGYFPDYFSINSLLGAIWVLSISYFPFVTLMSLAGIQSIDRNLEEAALLSRGKCYTMCFITFPLIFPHVFSGAIFVFIFSIIDFGVPDILRLNVYSIEIFIQFSAFYNEQSAFILSFPLIIVTILLIVVQQRYMKNKAYIQNFVGFSKTIIKPSKSVIKQSLVFGFSFSIIFLSSILPIGVLCNGAGSFNNYITAFSTSVNPMMYSFFLAFSGALCVMIFGFSLSYIIERSGKVIKNIVLYLSMIPFAIPSITMGICLIGIWNRPIIDIVYSSAFIIILGYIARFIPFSVIIFTSGLKQINHHIEEAALLIHPRWSTVMSRIMIPLLKPAIIVCFFIIFILSFGELGTTLLLMPPGTETLPVKIFNLMHYGAYELVNALCLIQIFIIFIFSFLFLSIYKAATKKVKK